MADKLLPGWSGDVGVDFSDYPIAGTNCANCRSLVAGDPPRCASGDFVASKTAGKKAGADLIPVRSKDPKDYCCNFWGLDGVIEKKSASPTRAWAAKVRAG